MSTVRSNTDLIRLAVVGLVALVAAFLIATNLEHLPLVDGGQAYRAEFADASGLVTGEEVRIAGIKVGTVTDLELGHARVIATFTVKGVNLGRGTTAGIEVKTLLGQHFLSVTPSGSGSLDEGSVIPLSRTSTPVNIVPAFQRLTTQVHDIDTAQVSEAFDALADALDRTAPEMTETLRGLSRLSQSVTSRDDAIRELFARTRQVSGVVAARDDDIAKLLADTNNVLELLDRRRKTIAAIIDGTESLAHQLAGLVTDNRTQLEPALEKLNGVIRVLRDNRTQIDAILKTSALYVREFANVGGTGHWFDTTIKAPQGYALCSTGTSVPGVDALLRTILSAINMGANGSHQPCLPLGPAVGEAP